MNQYRAPNGSNIIGTADTVHATAWIGGIQPDGTPFYDRGSSVHWDTQKPMTRDGKILFIDEDANTWTFDQLVKVTDDDKD